MKLPRFLVLTVLTAVMLAGGQARALDPATTGVVLLHGKWGDPSGVRPIGAALEAAGYTVERPAMPWAGYRSYDKGYEGAMEEVAQAVARLRAKGLARVVVGGHSLGANGALHFATLDPTLAAIILVAPAHSPEGRAASEAAAGSLQKAREMIAAGEGNDRASFVDINTGGRSRNQNIPANIYLSYYDPEGPAAMSLSAAGLKAGRVLWLAPSEDPTTRGFAALVAPRFPPTVKLDRVDVTADHLGAPQASAAAIVEWLNALPTP